MKLSVLFLLTLVAGCGFSRLEASAPLQSAQQVNLPEFVDDPVYRANEDIMAPRQKLIFYRNYDAIEEILKHDPAVVREAMSRRLEASQPRSLRLLAAAVLVLEKDNEGRQFFLNQARITEHVGDLYVTFDHIVWATESLTGSKPDLSWAEEMMIDALQNRTQVTPEDVIEVPFHWSEKTMELRAFAIDYGNFANHLAMMHSPKALPVIISLLRENPRYSLKSCIGYLGGYKDEEVKSLLLDILNKHEDSEHADTYRFAVNAASEMGLKAAVPILLRHLDDDDSYPGLRTLADASVMPTIRAALPRLKSYARAEAEFTLIHLQGGDELPQLLRLLARKDYLRKDNVLMRLEEFHDPRSVSTMAAALCYDPDSSVRTGSIRVLVAVRNKEAVRALINGLGCDYSKLYRFKTNRDYDYNGEYRARIAEALKEITGQNFGTDQKRWLLWLDQQKGI